MKTVASVAAALLIFGAPGAFAQGASQQAPGHQYGNPAKDAKPGQSGYAPGHQSGNRAKDAQPGQSGYAPGHNKDTTGTTGMGTSKPDKKR